MFLSKTNSSSCSYLIYVLTFTNIQVFTCKRSEKTFRRQNRHHKMSLMFISGLKPLPLCRCCRYITDRSGGGNRAALESLSKGFPSHRVCGMKRTDLKMHPWVGTDLSWGEWGNRSSGLIHTPSRRWLLSHQVPGTWGLLGEGVCLLDHLWAFYFLLLCLVAKVEMLEGAQITSFHGFDCPSCWK